MTAVSAPSHSLQTPAAAPRTTSPFTTRPRHAACQQEQRRLLNSPLSPSVPISHLLPGAWMRKRMRGRKKGRTRRNRAFVPQKQKENMKMKVFLPTSQSGQSRNVVRGSLRAWGYRSLFHRVKVKFKLLYITIVLQHIQNMLPTQVVQNPSNLKSSTPSMASAYCDQGHLSPSKTVWAATPQNQTWGTWKGAEDIHPAFKCPRSKSNWTTRYMHKKIKQCSNNTLMNNKIQGLLREHCSVPKISLSRSLMLQLIGVYLQLCSGAKQT